MKISLLFSASAGSGVSVDGLQCELQRAGHEIVRIVEQDADLHRLDHPPAELVVAAGGDCTVRRAASAVAGSPLPLGILPLGTANNVACSLGIAGSVAQVARRWETARERPLDLGIATCGSERRWFIESVGTGLVSRGIVDSGARPVPREDRRSRLVRALRAYRQILQRLAPRTRILNVDGVEVEGEFLLVEVLNVRYVGPNLVLSAQADCSDGCVDLVTAGEEHRRDLDDYLRQRIEGRREGLPLPTRRARYIELRGAKDLHVDDSALRAASRVMSVRVRAAAVRLVA